MMADVTAARVDDLLTGSRVAGSFKLYSTAEHNPAGLNFCCPCGCGKIGSVRFALPGQDDGVWRAC